VSEDHPVPQSAAESVPDEFPDICRRCGTKAPSVDGRCPNPNCRSLRKGTQLAAKHGPVNKTRRDQLRARFIQDYRPLSTIDEIRCRELADVSERLEVLKKGSPEYQRLVTTMASLDEALRASLATQKQAATPVSELSQEQLVSRLESLLASARGHAAPTATPHGDPAFRRDESTVDEHMGPPPQNIHIPTEIADPESSEPETAAARTETTPLVNSEPLETIPPTTTAPLPAGNKSASPTASVPLRTNPLLSDDEREKRAAAVRESLGWNVGVVSPNGIRRNRE